MGRDFTATLPRDCTLPRVQIGLQLLSTIKRQFFLKFDFEEDVLSIKISIICYYIFGKVMFEALIRLNWLYGTGWCRSAVKKTTKTKQKGLGTSDARCKQGATVK